MSLNHVCNHWPFRRRRVLLILLNRLSYLAFQLTWNRHKYFNKPNYLIELPSNPICEFCDTQVYVRIIEWFRDRDQSLQTGSKIYTPSQCKDSQLSNCTNHMLRLQELATRNLLRTWRKNAVVSWQNALMAAGRSRVVRSEDARREKANFRVVVPVRLKVGWLNEDHIGVPFGPTIVIESGARFDRVVTLFLVASCSQFAFHRIT